MHLEDETKEKITKTLVTELVWKTYADLNESTSPGKDSVYNSDHLQMSCEILLELVTAYEFIEFMTTYLYNHSIFRKLQNS